MRTLDNTRMHSQLAGGTEEDCACTEPNGKEGKGYEKGVSMRRDWVESVPAPFVCLMLLSMCVVCCVCVCVDATSHVNSPPSLRHRRASGGGFRISARRSESDELLLHAVADFTRVVAHSVGLVLDGVACHHGGVPPYLLSLLVPHLHLRQQREHKVAHGRQLRHRLPPQRRRRRAVRRLRVRRLRHPPPLLLLLACLLALPPAGAAAAATSAASTSAAAAGVLRQQLAVRVAVRVAEVQADGGQRTLRARHAALLRHAAAGGLDHLRDVVVRRVHGVDAREAVLRVAQRHLDHGARHRVDAPQVPEVVVVHLLLQRCAACLPARQVPETLLRRDLALHEHADHTAPPHGREHHVREEVPVVRVGVVAAAAAAVATQRGVGVRQQHTLQADGEGTASLPVRPPHAASQKVAAQRDGAHHRDNGAHEGGGKDEPRSPPPCAQQTDDRPAHAAQAPRGEEGGKGMPGHRSDRSEEREAADTEAQGGGHQEDASNEAQLEHGNLEQDGGQLPLVGREGGEGRNHRKRERRQPRQQKGKRHIGIEHQLCHHKEDNGIGGEEPDHAQHRDDVPVAERADEDAAQQTGNGDARCDVLVLLKRRVARSIVVPRGRGGLVPDLLLASVEGSDHVAAGAVPCHVAMLLLHLAPPAGVLLQAAAAGCHVVVAATGRNKSQAEEQSCRNFAQPLPPHFHVCIVPNEVQIL
eukprot:Rhum_TRINITY_DN5102_c0_g1::Rhum_TRINITY_DN5102_c0_g1_i1::g.16567::m.16567